MKLSLLLVTLSALVFSQAAVIQSPQTRANLNLGFVTTGDFLLYRAYVYRPAIANAYQYEDVVWRGAVNTNISAIIATEVGYTQYASARVIVGGLRANNATIRFESARGFGYYYLLDIWGR